MKLLDGVKKEMLQIEYWTTDNSLIMDNEDIINFNNKIISTDVYRRFSLKDGELPTDEKRREFVLYNLKQQKNISEFNEIENQIKEGLDHFGNEYKYGICLKRDAMMSLPISGTWEQRKKFTISPLHVNEGVIIYSETKDGKWVFIRSEIYYGWVKKDSIALCHSREEMIKYLDFSDFLVVIGESLTISFNESDKFIIKYDMGDRIEIIEEDKDNYYITIFNSNVNGYVVKKKGVIPKNACVYKGYLDFSKTNMISECFKCLGTGYKWGGGEEQRDCSSTVMEIFSTFGIIFPKSTKWQLKVPFKKYDLSELEIKDKCTILDSIPTGSLLFTERHVMIYLGKSEKEHFIFHNVGKFCQKDDYKEEHEYGVTISSLERTYTSDRKCWLNFLKTVLVIGNDS